MHPIRALCLAMLLFAAGCGVLPPNYDLHASNGANVDVNIVVNGHVVASMKPNDAVVIARRDLPPFPWAVAARTSTGRVLATMAVLDGSIQDHRALDGTGEYSAPAVGVALSCGRIEMYVGDVPPSGGGVALGVPGDYGP